MGVIRGYVCRKCGYTVELSLGSGVFDFLIVGVECLDCHNLMSKSLDIADCEIKENEKTCSFCGSKNLEIWDDGLCPCPKCNSIMDSEDLLFWD